jgi:hypothetical protein
MTNYLWHYTFLSEKFLYVSVCCTSGGKLQFILLLMMGAENTRNMQSGLAIKPSYYKWYLLHVSVLYCHPQGALPVPSERRPIEEQSTEYRGWARCVQRRGAWRSEIATHHATKHNTPIHNTPSTAPQFSISQKAPGTLPEDDDDDYNK